MRQEAAEREHDSEAAEPIRRCALTRATRPKDELLRFVLGPDGTIVPDLKEKLPGRGVWLTAAHDSVAEAAKRKVFARALKAEVKVPEGLADTVDRLLADAALGALGARQQGRRGRFRRRQGRGGNRQRPRLGPRPCARGGGRRLPQA